MKKKLISICLTVFVLAVMGCGKSSTSSNETAQENEGSTTNDETKEEDAADADAQGSVAQDEISGDNSQEGAGEQEEEDSTDEAKNAVYNIGDSAMLKEWSITVTDFQIAESIAGEFGSFSPDEEGNQYAQVFVTVANDGKSADTFLPSYGFGDDVNAKLLYGDGYEFSATTLMGYGNDLHNTHVNPLSSGSGEIAFDIPETVTSSPDEIVIQFKSGINEVHFKVR